MARRSAREAREPERDERQWRYVNTRYNREVYATLRAEAERRGNARGTWVSLSCLVRELVFEGLQRVAREEPERVEQAA